MVLTMSVSTGVDAVGGGDGQYEKIVGLLAELKGLVQSTESKVDALYIARQKKDAEARQEQDKRDAEARQEQDKRDAETRQQEEKQREILLAMKRRLDEDEARRKTDKEEAEQAKKRREEESSRAWAHANGSWVYDI